MTRPIALRRPLLAVAALSLAASACGTTYELQALQPAQLALAQSEISAERSREAEGPQLAPDEKLALYEGVVRAVEPEAERFCREETRAGTDCDFALELDRNSDEPANAYQTYRDERPTVIVTAAFLGLMRAPDDLAFVIGHEAGHHIAGHLDKKQTQTAVAGIGGALLGAGMLVLAAAAGVQPSQQEMQDMISATTVLGAAGGSVAYSQSYELEADMIGAYIAERAGFDGARGARVFARLGHGENEPAPSGAAAFWSTHPSSPERLAHIDLVVAEIAAQRAAGVTPAPTRKEDRSRVARMAPPVF